jgi:hypothetical protein
MAATTENLFLDKATAPTPILLAKALKARGKYWDELKQHVQGRVVEEWKYYGKNYGWSLKLLVGKRNLCFLTARDGFFTATFVLGDKGVSIAEQSKLPPDVISQLVNAKKYVEGRGIRIDVKSRRSLAHATMLLDIKLASWRA